MLRLVVLAGLLSVAAWSAREAGWLDVALEMASPDNSPHQSYAHALERAGLTDSSMGQAWLRASNHALSAPLRLDTPAEETLSFVPSVPRAWAFRVALQRGQRVQVVTDVSSDVPVEAFVDLFEMDDEHHTAAEPDTSKLRAVTHEADRDKDVVVRVQPELFRGGAIEMSVRTVPALRFPVSTARPRDLQSIFGDPRDGGRRQHEGVDIFAKRGTPVVSATDGVVLRVGESGLGGRVVWIWDTSRGLRLYYAHLDEQLVSAGQLVKAGDVIGAVGNTGNARTTPPHLHFGIYEPGEGAIDPFWFIAPSRSDLSHATR